MKSKQLCNDVLQWAEQKGILAEATIFSQFGKTLEEVNEYYTAKTRDEKIDAIGDVCVTLIILNEMLKPIYRSSRDVDIPRLIEDCRIVGIQNSPLHSSVGELASNIASSTYLGCFIHFMFPALHEEAKSLETALEHCLEVAYNEIKGRTGEMKNGVFVKDGV